MALSKPGGGLPGIAELRRRREEDARIRRGLDFAVRLPPAPAPPSRAERKKAAAKHLQLAAALRRAGQVAQSVGPLQQAVAADPDYPNAHFDLGLTLIHCARYAEAAEALRRAAALKPDWAKAHLLLGEACEALGRDAEAVGALRRAVAIAPGLAEAHRLLGRLLFRQEQFAEARQCFRRGAAAGRDTTVGTLCRAQLLAEEGDLTAAAELMRRTVARDRMNPLASATLVQMLGRLGDRQAAAAECERAVNAGLPPADAWAALANLRKMTEADRPMVARIEEYLAAAQPPAPSAQATLHFALGKAYDDLGDYAEAIGHFDAANRIRHELYPFDRAAAARHIDELIGQYSARFLAERRGEGSDDETPVLVTGMPRSGTTLVEQILSSHRLVAGAGELPFWAERFAATVRTGTLAMDATAVRRSAADYLALLRGLAPDAARIIDKSLASMHLLGVIMHALPRARVIHCRRHPVDTCLSIYFTQFESRAGFHSDRADLVFYYREYQRLAAHWQALLPPERFIEVDYERIVADPESEARRLVAFCGLEWDPACLRPQDNLRAVRTASMWQVRQPIYQSSLARWQRYEPWLGALCELLPGP